MEKAGYTDEYSYTITIDAPSKLPYIIGGINDQINPSAQHRSVNKDLRWCVIDRAPPEEVVKYLEDLKAGNQRQQTHHKTIVDEIAQNFRPLLLDNSAYSAFYPLELLLDYLLPLLGLLPSLNFFLGDLPHEGSLGID